MENIKFVVAIPYNSAQKILMKKDTIGDYFQFLDDDLIKIESNLTEEQINILKNNRITWDYFRENNIKISNCNKYEEKKDQYCYCLDTQQLINLKNLTYDTILVSKYVYDNEYKYCRIDTILFEVDSNMMSIDSFDNYTNSYYLQNKLCDKNTHGRLGMLPIHLNFDEKFFVIVNRGNHPFSNIYFVKDEKLLQEKDRIYYIKEQKTYDMIINSYTTINYTCDKFQIIFQSLENMKIIHKKINKSIGININLFSILLDLIQTDEILFSDEVNKIILLKYKQEGYYVKTETQSIFITIEQIYKIIDFILTEYIHKYNNTFFTIKDFGLFSGQIFTGFKIENNKLMYYDSKNVLTEHNFNYPLKMKILTELNHPYYKSIK